MQSIDMPYLCTVIGNLSGIPVRWYEGETQRFAYALASLPVDPMRLYQEEIWQVPGHVGYYVTPHFHYYGVVRCDRWRFVIVPPGRWRTPRRNCGSWPSGPTCRPTRWKPLSTA